MSIKDLTLDPPVTLDGMGSLDDRRYIDNQIRAIEEHLIDSVLCGVDASWFVVDSSVVGNLSSPMCAAMAGQDISSGLPTIIKATSTDRAFFLGIVLTTAAVGTKVRVATRGILPPTVTGIVNGGVAGFAVIDSTTGLPSFVTSLTNAHFVIGRVNAAGMLLLLGANINFTP